MKIGGFQPFTLSDFPGRVAAIVFTQGCNFRCPFCHNGALIPFQAPENALISQDYVLAYLEERRGRLDGVVVTGGEPTLQPDLEDFLRRVKALGLQVKLDTNGSRPETVAALLDEGLLDYVAMDVKAPLEYYPRLTGSRVPARAMEDTIALLTHSGVEHEFRTTYVEPLLTEADLRAIRALLPPRALHRIQKFNPEHALDPALRTAAALEKTAGAA
jgi:pyruvate formate lyase activating enzyme